MNTSTASSPDQTASSGRKRKTWWGIWWIAGAILLLAIPLLPIGSGFVVEQYRGHDSTAGRVTYAGLSASTQIAGAGACRSIATGAVPFGATSARGSIGIVEPAGCPTLHRLVFAPALRFPNGLVVTAGHVLTARLDVIRLAGTTAMLRNVQFTVRQIGGPISGPIQITNGVVTTRSTTPIAVAAPPATYGIRVVMTLAHPAVLSTATLTFLLSVYLNDGGVVRTVVFESITITLRY